MKLTPLNIATSACLVLGGFLLISPAQQMPVQKGINGMVIGLCFLAAIIAFISDLIFRKFIPLLRNLWVVECAFIVFTLVLMVIMKMTIA
ncbi:hypothetical protein [Pedobacter sp. L105]|uniref:hypothetical protein n=1 Tax=Pedobacter sp. L105 TaxID=1641871 RepID=UPI00131E8C04|nr:hypothetical protein [Pedobacter sp. L105]